MSNQYEEEARQKWGNSKEYKQSQERVKNLGEEGLKKVVQKNKELVMEIADKMNKGDSIKSEAVQALINRHYNGLKVFYEPNLELYRGLAATYISDERFKNYYEKFAEGLARFMYDAMIYYIDQKNT